MSETGHRPATRKKIRTPGEISGEKRPTITSSSASTSFLPDDASSQVRRVSDKKLRGWDTLTCVYKVGWVRKKREWEKRNKRERERRGLYDRLCPLAFYLLNRQTFLLIASPFFLFSFVLAKISLSLSTWRRSLVCVLCVICAGWILCRECIRPPAYTHTHAFRRRKTCRPWCGVGGWVGEYRPPLMAARIRKKEESSAPAAPIMVLSRAHRVPVSSSVWSNIDVVSFHPFLFF